MFEDTGKVTKLHSYVKILIQKQISDAWDVKVAEKMKQTPQAAIEAAKLKKDGKSCIDNPLNVSVPWINFLEKKQKPESVIEMVRQLIDNSLQEVISDKGYYYRLSFPASKEAGKPPSTFDPYCEIRLFMDSIEPEE